MHSKRVSPPLGIICVEENTLLASQKRKGLLRITARTFAGVYA